MNYKQHGTVAILLIGISSAIAGYSVFKYAGILMFALFIIIGFIGFLTILLSYCRKCYQKNKECVHLNIGKLTSFMPEIKAGSYTIFEIIATLVSVSVVLLFPQIWLYKNIKLLVPFWVLLILAIVDIKYFVCKGCKNTSCIACRNKALMKKG